MSLHFIPGFVQSPLYCGPACLKMILYYYGTEVSEDELGRVAKTTLEHGTTNENLLLAAQAYGLDGRWHEFGTLEELRGYTEKDIPIIVEWFSSGEGPEPGEPHFSIVIGVDETHVILLDPEDGKRYEFSQIKFMSVWFSFSGPFIKNASEVHVRWYLPLTKA